MKMNVCVCAWSPLCVNLVSKPLKEKKRMFADRHNRNSSAICIYVICLFCFTGRALSNIGLELTWREQETKTKQN